MRDEYKIKCNHKFLIINDLKSCAFALHFLRLNLLFL